MTKTELGHLMQAEINEQPTMFARILHGVDGDAARIADLIRDTKPRMVLITARGTSDHAALYAKYLIETTIQIPVGLVSNSSLTVYGARPDLRGVLWIAVSQSGGSPDLVESTEIARKAGALTLAATNSPSSPLAQVSEHHLDVQAGVERAVAATKSYTAQLLTLWLLVQSWSGRSAAAADRLADQVAWVVARCDIGPIASRYRFAERVVLTARGLAYPTAREGALKLMETSYVAAQAFSAADLMHGPLASLDARHPVLAIVPTGRAGSSMSPTLRGLRRVGVDLTTVGQNADADLRLPTIVDETLAPIVEVVPLQMLALQMARDRGIDADQPRGLLKETHTR